MLGHDDDYIAALERAHNLYVEAGTPDGRPRSLRPRSVSTWPVPPTTGIG
jgi:hypothetical protein